MNRTNETITTESGQARRRSPLFVLGGIMWLLVVVAIFFGKFASKEKTPPVNVSTATEADSDDGRNPKKRKLVQQADGSLVAEEVKPEDDVNPWGTDGIEDFSFTDTEGRKITKQDLIGKPFLISFVFTMCRGPCPNVTLQMQALQNGLKNYDFNLVTLTVDPERDTTDVLQNYGKAHGADFGKWTFLTGDQAEIYGLIHRSFKMPVEEAKGVQRKPGFEIIHSTNIMLVDAKGNVVGKYNATNDEEMARLRKDLKNLCKSQKQPKS